MLPLAVGDRVILINGQRGIITHLEDMTNNPPGFPQRITIQLENGLSSVFSDRMISRLEEPHA